MASASSKNRWKRPLITLASSIRSSLKVTLHKKERGEWWFIKRPGPGAQNLNDLNRYEQKALEQRRRRLRLNYRGAYQKESADPWGERSTTIMTTQRYRPVVRFRQVNFVHEKSTVPTALTSMKHDHEKTRQFWSTETAIKNQACTTKAK